LAAIEGLACGMGVISTPVSGIKEIIEPGKNGYIFEMGNPSSLTSLLNNISAHKQPIPLPEICKSSINEYEYQNACKSFYDDCKQVIFSKIQDVCSLTT
jgi:glycosyltransferase involved in cell wall biosynthesis